MESYYPFLSDSNENQLNFILHYRAQTESNSLTKKFALHELGRIKLINLNEPLLTGGITPASQPRTFVQ